MALNDWRVEFHTGARGLRRTEFPFPEIKSGRVALSRFALRRRIRAPAAGAVLCQLSVFSIEEFILGLA